MINGGIINFNGGAGGSGGSSSGVTNLGVAGGADLTGAVDLFAPSGFVVLGDNGGSSPITIAVDVHAMSGLWGLTPGGGAGAIDSVGVLGGADLTGDIDFTDPSGFIVWGDSAGSSPILASIDTHALSGLWDLNQINVNKSNLAASGQVILNELNVSGQVLLTEINTKADQSSLDASGQILLSNDAASGQVTLSVLNVSGQVLLENVATSGQVVLNELNASGQVLLSNDNASGQYLWSELKGSGQLLLSNTAASGQLLVSNQDCDWNGFPNRSDSIISFDHSTRTFSIQPTGSEFAYYIGCTQYLSTGDTLIIGSGEGIHLIYYDDDVLTEVLNPSDAILSTTLRTTAWVSMIYWGTNQASGIYVGEERHGMSMSPVTHAYLHFSEGLRYLDGLGLNNITADGNGSVDDFAVFGVDTGVVADEDLLLTVAAIPSGEGLPVYYMTGSTPNWNKVDPSGFSVRTFDQTENTRLAYNQFTGGAWQLTEVTNKDFVLCHVFATTEKDKPMIAIMGQAQYLKKGAARDGAEIEILSLITNNILLPEIRPIATLIYQTDNNYSNQVKGRIVTTDDGDDYIDWRNEEISRVALTTSNHNNLNGLQGGAANEYFHLTEAQRDNVITLPASGQVLLNELAVSGQVLLSNDAVSGQVVLNELNVSGQVLLQSAGGGAVDSVGVEGGADLTGDVDFTDPSGFIVWGDTGGASPVTTSIDTHALSGLWDLNQININKSSLAASGQVVLNELAVSGQVLLTEIGTKADQTSLDASGQVLLTNDAASGQYLWNELNVSGQLLLTDINTKADQSSLDASGQVLLNNDAVSGQIILSNVVRSVGTQGGADLTGDVDFSDPSGFIVWGDTGGASPVTASIDVHALSGLWNLGNVGSYRATISVASNIWTITHGLNSKDLILRLWDNNDFAIEADSVKTDSVDQVTINFTSAIAGRVDIIAVNGNAAAGKIDEPFYQGNIAFNMATSGAAYATMLWDHHIIKDFAYTTSHSGIIVQKEGVYRCTAELLSSFNSSEQWAYVQFVKNGYGVYGTARLYFTPANNNQGLTTSVTYLLAMQSGDILGVQAKFTAADPGSIWYAAHSSLTVNRVNSNTVV